MSRLAALWASGDSIAISDLVRLECRLQPLRMKDTAALAQYDTLFSQANVDVMSIDTAVFDRATAIRAAHNFKLADALHLATAIESRCDRLLTNDARLSNFSDIFVEVLA